MRKYLTLTKFPAGAAAFVLAVALSLMLSACSSFAGNLFVPKVDYTVGGVVSGLAGSGLVLQDNGGSNLPVAASATTFAFASAIASGGSYNVTVLSQPSSPSQTCVVANGSGPIQSASVTTVKVTCTKSAYTIGGDITGLTSGGLILQDNGGDNLAVNAGATSFTFRTSVLSGDGYDVTVLSQPSNLTQTCAVTGGSGPVGNANVTTVHVACSTAAFTIGGTISGLTGGGLILQDNGGDNLAVNAGATSFTFSTPVSIGASYNVAGFAQPSNPTQTCTVANGSGTVGTLNVTTVQVNCVSPSIGTFAYVSNRADNTISAYRVAADGTLAPVPGSPFATGRGPSGLAVDPSGSFLYVANILDDNVSGFAISGNGALSPLPGSPFPAASGAISVAIDPSGKFVYVPRCGANCSGSGPGSIAAFTLDSTTGALVPVPGSPFPAGTYPYEMAFAPGGAYAYVGNNGSNQVYGYSLQSNGALTSLPGSPYTASGMDTLALAVDSSSSRLFTVNSLSNDLSAFSIQPNGSLTLIAGSTTATASFTSSAVTDSNQHLYVAGGSGVLGFVDSTAPLTALAGSPFAVAGFPNCVRMSPGNFLYAVDEPGNNVVGYSVNPAGGTLTPVGTFATGSQPYCIAFAKVQAPPDAMTWYLSDVTFNEAGIAPPGAPGPISATGFFIYDAQTHTMLDWDIAVSGAMDPIINFEYTPSNSFIPSLDLYPTNDPGKEVEFIRSLPGNPIYNVFGTSPYDSNSVLTRLDFFESPGNAGLPAAGGTVRIVTGATVTYDIPQSLTFPVQTGCVTTVSASNPCFVPPVIPPSGVVVYSSIGSACCSAWPVSGASSSQGFNAAAMGFIPTASYELTQIEVSLTYNGGTNSGPILTLNADNNGKPGAVLLKWNLSAPLLATSTNATCCSAIETVFAIGPFTLNAGSRYWLVASPGAADTWDEWVVGNPGTVAVERNPSGPFSILSDNQGGFAVYGTLLSSSSAAAARIGVK